MADIEQKTFNHKEDPCELCDMKWKDDPIGDCSVKLLEHYRDVKAEGDPYFKYMGTVKDRLKAAVKFQVALTGEVGDIIDIQGAKVKVIAPKKPRVYWDSKALDGYAAAHPEILQFRTEKMPNPSIRIDTV